MCPLDLLSPRKCSCLLPYVTVHHRAKVHTYCWLNK
uniref:Uncharacterized protein n=1 Tax=Anguilla anguilla TaxID=7936 RepID=A0A0E9V4A1_ANGAN